MTEEEPRLSRTAGGSAAFLYHYGLFHAVFGTLDLTIDVAIGRFLKISHSDAHLMMIGLEFGRRMQLLINLAERSDDTNKTEIVRLAKKIQSDSRRNVFAHSFLSTNEHSVTFIYRHREKPLEAKEYTFTNVEFQKHVFVFLEDAKDLQVALGIKNEDFRDFAAAVIKDTKRVGMFPDPPNAKT